MVHTLSRLDVIPPRLADVMAFLIPISKRRSIVSVVSQVLLAAITYGKNAIRDCSIRILCLLLNFMMLLF